MDRNSFRENPQSDVFIRYAIKIYTRSVFDALEEKDVSQIKFYEL